jgi:hypothetical protein
MTASSAFLTTPHGRLPPQGGRQHPTPLEAFSQHLLQTTDCGSGGSLYSTPAGYAADEKIWSQPRLADGRSRYFNSIGRFELWITYDDYIYRVQVGWAAIFSTRPRRHVHKGARRASDVLARNGELVEAVHRTAACLNLRIATASTR